MISLKWNVLKMKKNDDYCMGINMHPYSEMSE